MTFGNSTGDISISPVGSGELWDDSFSITTHDFNPTIKTGKFASINNGILATGVTGTLAGVVCRDITSSLEVAADDDVHPHTAAVRFVISGAISVTVETGKTPSFRGKVYTNATGEATTDIDTETHAEFIRKVKEGVWLIRLI